MNYLLKSCLVVTLILLVCPLVSAEVEIPDYDAATEAATPAKKEEVMLQENKPTSTENMPVSVSESIEIPASIPASTPEKSSVSDKIISATFKSLARGFVAVVNLDSVKEKHLAKMNKMSEEKFRKQFNKAYEVLKDLPEELRKQYKITKNTSKEQIIQNLTSLNKARMYQMIDLLPDWVIAKHFRDYLNKTGQEVEKSSAVVKIKSLWESWISKADK